MKREHNYIVVTPHTSEYPEPMFLKKGDLVSVGEKYEGSEDWPDWYLCSAPGQKDGWVPAQIITRHTDGSGVIQEDFITRELNVIQGERISGTRQLNGWLWATKCSDQSTGWVPLENIRPHDAQPQS